MLWRFAELRKIGERLGVQDAIIGKAERVCLRALEREVSAGWKNSELVASALYLACRATRTPRTVGDVEAASGLRQNKILRRYKLLLRGLNLEVPPMEAASCLETLAERVGASERARRDASDLLKRAAKTTASAGKNPISVAAAALYLSCNGNGQKRTQQDLAEAAGVTSVTIRQRSRDFEFGPSVAPA